MEEEKPASEEPKKEEIVEKKQERDWRLDEDFKKFMSSPSIESALKLERKRAEEKLKEINNQDQDNFFKNIINFFVRYYLYHKWRCHLLMLVPFNETFSLVFLIVMVMKP